VEEQSLNEATTGRAKHGMEKGDRNVTGINLVEGSQSEAEVKVIHELSIPILGTSWKNKDYKSNN
jgi:hypothetical protein